MGARTRPMALDGRSVDADLEQTAPRITAVQAIIMRTFAEDGPLTDDALIAAVERRQRLDPSLPKASPSSIRSRRAELSRRGIVRATNLPGRSAYGRPATVHILASTAREASCLL